MNTKGTMRAIRVHAPGGPEAMQEERIAIPEPGPGDALVRVEFAGVNFIDVYKRSGQYKIPLPATIGEEGAGEVVAVGDKVTEVRLGDRVAWASVLGAYAEYAVVKAARLVPLPLAIETRVAAATMLQGMTAHYLAFSTRPLGKGDRALIHAAAGGVGLLLVQIASKQKAFVIGTASTDEKAVLAQGAGAECVIVYTRDDFVTETKRLTEGACVHVVYDSVGQSTFLRGLEVLAPRGMMVLFGQSSGAAAPIDPQELNRRGSLFLTRPTLAHYTATRNELLWRSGELFDWIALEELSVRVGAEFPLSDAAAAHRALEARQTTGKVLLRV